MGNGAVTRHAAPPIRTAAFKAHSYLSAMVGSSDAA